MSLLPKDFVQETLMTRRQFVRLTVVGGATVLWMPACQNSTPPESLPPPPRFFTDEERSALAVLADYVLPPDDVPGGSALGAVEYIETLLTAFEYDPPRIFADGPFSNRNPIPLPDGTPSNVFPENGFARFLPLSREQEIAWRLQIYGSGGVSGGGPNEAIIGPIVGWRDVFRKGLAQAAMLAGGPVVDLDDLAIGTLWGQLDANFVWLLMNCVVEAAFGPPEYGGNRSLAGWQMIHFAGDTLPFGFAPFDQTTGTYRERPDVPISTPNPGPDLDPIDQDTDVDLRLIVAVLGGRVA